MADYISAENLSDEILRVYERANFRLVIIVPVPQLQKLNLTKLLEFGSDPKLKIQVLVNAPERIMVFRMSEIRDLMKIENMELLYHKGNMIQQFLNDTESLITPRGVDVTNYNKAGIKSFIGIDDNKDICQILEEATLLLKKEPTYKSKYFGLSKKYINSEVTSDRLKEYFALIEN